MKWMTVRVMIVRIMMIVGFLLVLANNGHLIAQQNVQVESIDELTEAKQVVEKTSDKEKNNQYTTLKRASGVDDIKPLEVVVIFRSDLRMPGIVPLSGTGGSSIGTQIYSEESSNIQESVGNLEYLVKEEDLVMDGSIEDRLQKELESEILCQEVMVYPNPAKDYTILSLPNRANYQATLYDMTGKKRAAWRVSNRLEERLDLSNMETGLYFLQVGCGSETKTIQIKIVK